MMMLTIDMFDGAEKLTHRHFIWRGRVHNWIARRTLKYPKPHWLWMEMGKLANDSLRSVCAIRDNDPLCRYTPAYPLTYIQIYHTSVHCTPNTHAYSPSKSNKYGWMDESESIWNGCLRNFLGRFRIGGMITMCDASYSHALVVALRCRWLDGWDKQGGSLCGNRSASLINPELS